MNPDDLTVRPVVYGNAVRPVHRETPPRDSTGRQRASKSEPTEPEQPETTDDSVPLVSEETHLIDLQV